MLFASNRRFNEGLNPNNVFPRTVTFAKGDNEPLQQFFCCVRNTDGTYQEIGSTEWFNRMKSHSSKHILFILHGFNTPPLNALNGAARLQTSLGDKYLIVPLIWACEDSEVNLAERYYSDRPKAEASGVAFARLLFYWYDWASTINTPSNPCFAKISILAHSMGNRVLCHILKQVQSLGRPWLIPNLFKHAFLFASDIVNHALEPGQVGELIALASQNVVVAYANDDTALQVSKGVYNTDANSNEIGSRLGHTGLENWSETPDNCTDWDCTAWNQEFDNPTGHTYFFEPSPLFRFMKEILETGIVKLPDSNVRGGMKLSK